MAQSELFLAIKHICDEKNLPMEAVISTIEAALAAAFRKDFADKNQNIRAEFDVKTGKSRIFDVKTVVADVDLEEQEKLWEAQKAKREAGEEIPEDQVIKRFNPKADVMVTEAQTMKKGAKVGDEIVTELTVPAEYGRMAAQTAKQVIIQRLREAERANVFENFKDRVGQIVNATVQRMIGRNVILDIGQAQGVLTPEEQIRGERYNSGSRFRVYIVSVEMKAKGPEIVASRAHAGLVQELFAMEVPEVSSGVVEIKAIAREAGSRTKLAVWTEDENIDPVGSCVGQRGTRVQTVISELGGEKIDIIPWNEDINDFIEQSLSPAKIVSVEVNESEKSALVKVSEDQLSLAIGRSGQNVRLASKLTGYKINIASEDGTIQGTEKIAEAPSDAAVKVTDNEATVVATETDLPAVMGETEVLAPEPEIKKINNQKK